MRTIALLSLLVASPAMADSDILMKLFGPSGTGPAPASISMATHVQDDGNVLMMPNASDAASAIKSITIIGNGKVLVTRAPPFMFVWARTTMRSGDNTIVLQSVNAAGVTRQAKGYVTKP